MWKTVAVGVVVAAALIDARPSQAYQGPWCAYMTLSRDMYEGRCDLPNYAACQAEIAATPGTWCTENPRYRGPVGQPKKVKRQRR